MIIDFGENMQFWLRFFPILPKHFIGRLFIYILHSSNTVNQKVIVTFVNKWSFPHPARRWSDYSSSLLVISCFPFNWAKWIKNFFRKLLVPILKLMPGHQVQIKLTTRLQNSFVTLLSSSLPRQLQTFLKLHWGPDTNHNKANKANDAKTTLPGGTGGMKFNRRKYMYMPDVFVNNNSVLTVRHLRSFCCLKVSEHRLAVKNEIPCLSFLSSLLALGQRWIKCGKPLDRCAWFKWNLMKEASELHSFATGLQPGKNIIDTLGSLSPIQRETWVIYV